MGLIKNSSTELEATIYNLGVEQKLNQFNLERQYNNDLLEINNKINTVFAIGLGLTLFSLLNSLFLPLIATVFIATLIVQKLQNKKDFLTSLYFSNSRKIMNEYAHKCNGLSNEILYNTEIYKNNRLLAQGQKGKSEERLSKLRTQIDQESNGNVITVDFKRKKK